LLASAERGLKNPGREKKERGNGGEEEGRQKPKLSVATGSRAIEPSKAGWLYGWGSLGDFLKPARQRVGLRCEDLLFLSISV